MTLLSLLSLLPLLSASPIQTVHLGRDTGSSLLNSSYLAVKFLQSLDHITSYSEQSIADVTSREDYPGGWVGENGWTAISEFDYEHSSRQFYDQVSNGLAAFADNPGGCFPDWQVPAVNCFNDDAGWAALANLQSYAAYGDEGFLDRAKGVWQFVTDHGYIHQSDIDAGYLVGTKYQNNTLQGSCNGQSMLGGVYWQNGVPSNYSERGASSDVNVNAVSTGLYALLGAKLCRLTQNTTYCDMAYSSMWWMDRLQVSPEGLIYDHVNGTSCAVKTEWIFTYNAGLYIAAYAELGNLTSNSTALDLSHRTLVASLQTPIWNTPQGIIKEGNGNVTAKDDGIGFKSILIRYLHKVYEYFDDEETRDAIRDYINIQYYAITQLDSDNPDMPVEYGRNWTGTYEVSTGQTIVAALDVLNGLVLNPNSTFPTTNDTDVPVVSAS